MRSTASSNETKTIIKDCLRKYWTVPALGLFWLLVWGAVPMMMNRYHESTDQLMQTILDLSVNTNIGYIIGILILAIGSGMTVFAYLQSPGASQYMHSLPVSRARLFAVHTAAGLIMMAGPVLVNGIVMIVLTGEPMLFLKWMAATGVCCFAIFALTALAAMLSGNTLMHLFNAGFCNGFVTLVLLTIYVVCQDLLDGYAPSDAWTTLAWHSNALTAFIGSSVHRWLLCLIYLAAGAAALVLAWFLYRRRAVERTGNSVIFPWVRSMLFLVCIFCGAILTGLLFAELLGENNNQLNRNMCIGMLVGALLVYLIGSVMIDRSARIFTRRNLLPAGLALAAAFALTAGISADVTGYSSRVPAASDIRAAYVAFPADSLMPAYGIYGYESYEKRFDARYYDNADPDLTQILGDTHVMGFTEGATVAAVQDLHRALIGQEKKTGYRSGSVKLLYQLKSGRLIRREYSLYSYENGYKTTPAGQKKNLITDLDPQLEQAAAAIYNTEEFRDQYSPLHLKAEIFPGGTASWNMEVEVEDDAYMEDSRVIPTRDMGSLQKALARDFANCDYREAMTCSDTISIVAAGSSWQTLTFPVPDSGKAMKKWRKAHKDILK